MVCTRSLPLVHVPRRGPVLGAIDVHDHAWVDRGAVKQPGGKLLAQDIANSAIQSGVVKHALQHEAVRR